jgi:putative addiction module killer protein
VDAALTSSELSLAWMLLINYNSAMTKLLRLDPFIDWFARLRDRRARDRINARLRRLAAGNAGDSRPLGGGLHELRIDYGPGYRVYYGWYAGAVVLLLAGGDKSTQSRDVAAARALLARVKAEGIEEI